MSEQNVGDRYEVPPGNVEAEYADAAQLVLVNKKGITDLEKLQLAEEEALALAYEALLSEVRTDTPMTCELLKHIHRRIFGELFEWAGCWRTVQLSKPGAIWPPPVHLDQAMELFERNVLSAHPAATLAADEPFCRSIAEIQGEFLAIHPFREGNARSIKLMTDLLAAQTNRPLLVYDHSPEGMRRYIDAAKAALLRKDYVPMTEITRQALSAAQKQ